MQNAAGDQDNQTSQDIRDIHPSQMSYTFGKPLTEEEFQKLKQTNSSVQTIRVPPNFFIGNGSSQESLFQKETELKQRIRAKIRESQDKRAPTNKTKQ